MANYQMRAQSFSIVRLRILAHTSETLLGKFQFALARNKLKVSVFSVRNVPIGHNLRVMV